MSLMPKRGVCFSCGHDHGEPGSFMPPDMERMATAHIAEMAIKTERIAKLERENAELRKVPQEVRPAEIDKAELLKLANQAFGETVDCDLRGNSITNYDVLLHGAFAPAVMRLVNLAVRTYAHRSTADASAPHQPDSGEKA